ncbi:hypothetical protein Esti_001028 [Eimeria stiedai]
MAVVFAQVVALLTCLCLLLTACLAVPCCALSRAGWPPLRALADPRACSTAFFISPPAVCSSSRRGIHTPSCGSEGAGRLQQRKAAPGGKGRDPWGLFARNARGVLSSAAVNLRLRHPEHCLEQQSFAGGPHAHKLQQPLNHDATPEASAQKCLGGLSRGSLEVYSPQTQSPVRPFWVGPQTSHMRGPWRPPGGAGSLRSSHGFARTPPRSQSGLPIAKATTTTETAPARAAAARAPLGQPSISKVSKPASLSVGSRASSPWGQASPHSTGRGRRSFDSPPVDTEALCLRVGQHVKAACVRVWARYALLRLLPPSADRGPLQRDFQGPTGFLHASGLRRGGMPLQPVKSDKVNLTELLRVGASFTVELVGPPSAANSQRWQLALHLPPAKGPCESTSYFPMHSPTGGAEQGHTDESTQEGPSPDDASSCASSDEIWGQDDCSILLEGEVGPLQRPVKGHSAGRRRRASSGGAQEDLQKKRVDGLREEGRHGRSIWGGRRSGTARDDDESDGNSFLIPENPEDDLLLEAEREQLSSAPTKSFLAEPLPKPTQSPSLIKRPAAAAAPETSTASTAFRAIAAKTRGKSAQPGSAKKRPPCPVRLEPRAAVVAVLGHVDHGKTTLLRALRRLTPISPSHSCVPSSRSRHQEAGGITQRIGFFEMQLPEGLAASSTSLTFLDTPGHAAFSHMRLRAAKAADLVVLVVAANEGVQEETRRCLQICKELKLPLVVVISKTDLVGTTRRRPSKEPLNEAAFLADPEGAKILGALAAEGLLTEPLGGPVQVAAVNAKGFLHAQAKERPFGGLPGEDPHGMQHLLECIVLQAEVLGLHAAADGLGKGVILETHCSAARGGSASLLLKEGTVKLGDWVVVGPSISRVRRLRFGSCAEGGGLVASSNCAAKPRAADVVEVFGFYADCLPAPGEEALVVGSEEEAKKLQAKFADAAGSAMAAAAAEQAHRRGIERLHRTPREQEVLPVVIRAEAHGAAAAVAAALESITSQRDSSGIWRLCSSDNALARHKQEPSKHLLQVQANSAAEDAKVKGEKKDVRHSRDNSDISNSSDSSSSEEPAPATRRVRVLRATAGECSSQDVHACTNKGKKGGLLVAFATKVSRDAKRQAAEKHVELLQCDVIYDAIEAVEARLLSPSLFSLPLPGAVSGTTSGTPTTQATVKQLFNLSNGSVVAGCDVISGRLRRGGVVRIVRAGGECIKEATRVLSLRVGKEARDCVASPAQCGVICEAFKDWQLGDSIFTEEQPAEATSTS